MSLELGKYAFTVLSAWGATLVLLAAVIVQTLIANTRARRALDAEETRLAAQGHAPAAGGEAPAERQARPDAGIIHNG